ncbi:MAG TPA: glycosyltransferase family 39 protein [Phototrophicaceae bacterium]|nr:glycosyltransferase family 39 protein [Phototrophicaceae bacterium]
MKSPIWWQKLGRYERILIILFLVSLPLVNPWVRGDGIGYYAYARALALDHNLQFEKDWRHANTSFRSSRVDPDGRIRADQYTSTGHLDNHFTIGPALIWIPFLVAAHAAVLTANHLGAHIAADGYSWPYLDTMAVVTAFCGFASLFISFRLARKYFPERWAFLAVLGIWLASSLPVYMYFNPSWSHAQSAFIVALFIWYWDRTRANRTTEQWCILGFIGGLMMDMYYPNAVFLLVLVVEIGIKMAKMIRSRGVSKPGSESEITGCLLFSLALITAFLPTLITRWIVFGSPFNLGYSETSIWTLKSPLLGRVLFSADHGLFSWTPVLLLASAGLFLLWRKDKVLCAALALAAIAFYFMIATYPVWDGISSYGNRFFVSLTPLFIIGLAALLTDFERLCRGSKVANWSAAAALCLFIAWNFGLMFQWGMKLIPARGPISWTEAVHNQFRVVPATVADSAMQYFTGRHELMRRIEKQDMRQVGEIESIAQPSRAKE